MESNPCTDETWVTSGFHTRISVTRKAGEELDPTCLREVVRASWDALPEQFLKDLLIPCKLVVRL